jgi:hypothetical protein
VTKGRRAKRRPEEGGGLITVGISKHPGPEARAGIDRLGRRPGLASAVCRSQGLSLRTSLTHLSSTSCIAALDSPPRGRFVRLMRNGEDNRTMALPGLQL